MPRIRSRATSWNPGTPQPVLVKDGFCLQLIFLGLMSANSLLKPVVVKLLREFKNGLCWHSGLREGGTRQTGISRVPSSWGHPGPSQRATGQVGMQRETKLALFKQRAQ